MTFIGTLKRYIKKLETGTSGLIPIPSERAAYQTEVTIPPNIFVSYRRDDSSGYTGRLYDTLRVHFGPQQVFMDIDTIEPGESFLRVIEDAISSCNILIVVIGRYWLTADGRERLNDSHDFVRMEIDIALRRNIPVLPVLVQGALMPRAEMLPGELVKLAHLQAVEISDTRWRSDVERLMNVIRTRVSQRAPLESERLTMPRTDSNTPTVAPAITDASPILLEEQAERNLQHLPDRPLLVFLCHSSGDKPSVRTLYQKLKADGIEPWLDEESLLPGEEWEREIPKAVRKSDVVIVCLSRGSINKSGYIQKEIKFALDIADEQPEGTIFLIPLKLEECEVPERFRRWHWVNLFEEKGYVRLMSALKVRASKLSAER